MRSAVRWFIYIVNHDVTNAWFNMKKRLDWCGRKTEEKTVVMCWIGYYVKREKCKKQQKLNLLERAGVARYRHDKTLVCTSQKLTIDLPFW